MEVFCRNVPAHLKDHHLRRELAPILAQLDIITFECKVFNNRHARITIGDIFKANQLLRRYPRMHRGKRLPEHQILKIHGTIIYIEEGKNKPDPYLLLSLQEEETQRRSRPRRPLSVTSDTDSQRPRKFHIQSYSCGTFDFKGTNPVFVEQFARPTSGTIDFGPTKLTIAVECPWDASKNLKIETEYRSIFHSIFVSDRKNNLTVTFSCYYAPRLYLAAIKNPMVVALSIFRNTLIPREEKKIRLGFLEPGHRHVVATCFVYRVTLRNPNDRANIWRLAHNPNRPKLVKWNEIKMSPSMSYQDQLVRFIIELGQIPFPFAVKFQLQMLVWNGELPMNKVFALFPFVKELLARKRPLVVAKILKGLPRRLQHPDPHADSADVSVENIIEILQENEELQALETIQPGQPGYLYHNQIEIHRASVTPTGIYLDGPNCEAQNRVLRKFRQHSDYFLRVRFIEESGDLMMYDISTNLDEIFNSRFRNVLQEGIVIADRHYQFLGFSHSSLRSRTCWFMAEFEDSFGELITVENLVFSKLGNFSHIRSPSKFAARLGQTFSDTLTSISIDRHMVTNINDVERNGRVFSDGCGTISREILWRIYRDYPRNAAVNPTVFQVRISGAKGMLSLDSTLKGPIICLRDSMIKFQAEADTNIEICGSGIHKLPCYLNAPLIKILEDLGVPRDLFVELQRQEVEYLRQTMHSPRQAAIFLDQSYVSKSTRLPWLISTLESLGLHYVHDSFLKRAVELVILMKLRDLKYKSRIIVPKAVTLYGIMDETGILKEGEIFVPILNDQNRREILIHRDVIVTRSPAFHPGDVQLANAVNVPEDSPLRKLHNCVVFSQHGERDLPSQLSGGDLDGDLFNIIYDNRFRLLKRAIPADYPRVAGTVLNRPVVIDDIKDFFITFMRQDQLGRIANTHKILADREAAGTFDPKCLTLAQLHSTAVDFSKTGTPVDVSKIPKYPPYRPDFMAPGPRVRVAESIEILENGREHLWDDDKNDGRGGPADDDDDDDVRPPLRYYKSQRVLGHLYREIDEKDFMNDLRWESFDESESVNVLHSLWEYVKRETAGFFWDHCVQDAKYFRDIYEESLEDLMYQYSDTPWKTSLTEVEVFIGNIMGQNHKQTTNQKESSRAMRDAYDDLVKWTMSLITGKGTEHEPESLERSVACFWVSLDDNTTTTRPHQSTLSSSGVLPGHKKLRSYAWIAAITCLQEIDKLQRQMPF